MQKELVVKERIKKAMAGRKGSTDNHFQAKRSCSQLPISPPSPPPSSYFPDERPPGGEMDFFWHRFTRVL